MSETVFTQVNYDLNSLVDSIELGHIGLPNIQRPFVWRDSKVRDLFDSMYKGYPVGYLLLWQSSAVRTIGPEKKQMPSQLLIVDGQQRLTSLYAIFKGVPVLRENYEWEKICIAFNPLEAFNPQEECFQVADAAIRRDKEFIPDISVAWSKETDIFELVENYLDGLRASRSVTEEETKKVKKAIIKLQALRSFPFTALVLAPNISEKDVSDVFVRINSKGTSLNQADFILTLMSVFWDEGRAEIEQFCREARKPSKGEESPFNYFIEPKPEQLLRVAVGLAFKRARLKYVYSILRGKDLETEQFSEERRIAQFDLLKDAQRRTLNLQHWHDFMNCIRIAGFRSGTMISSQANLLFSYMLYLIGRTEYDVKEFTLRKAIAQWFFMSAVTGRYTKSPESAMEFDLARLRDVKTPEQFIAKLQQVCDIALTNDFWETALPNDLATSSPSSPSLFAYNASLVLLDANVLFSSTKIADLLDPAIHPRRGPIERHHLFPKDYLATLSIASTRDTNQIANYAFVEWGDNSKISNEPPAKYVSELEKRFNSAELASMNHFHALPENWAQMEYSAFLEKRREMMAQIIREGYRTLKTGPTPKASFDEPDLADLINTRENDSIEFKSTLRINLHTGTNDKRIELAVLKTLAGFLNTDGGTLIIGVSDDGAPVGINRDGFPNEDKMSLHLVNIVKDRMGPEVMTTMNTHFDDYENNRIMVIRCKRSPSPVYVKDDNVERFYIRTGPSTTELTLSQAQSYIKQRFN